MAFNTDDSLLFTYFTFIQDSYPNENYSQLGWEAVLKYRTAHNNFTHLSYIVLYITEKNEYVFIICTD